MKTKLTLLLVLLFAGTTMLRAQNEECITTMSIFSEHAKVKNYDAAYEPFMKLRKDCPKVSFALFQYGERLLKDKIEKAPEGEKKAVAQDLIKMYGEKYTNFPDKTKQGANISEMAEVMYDNKMGTKMDQFKKFQEAWKADKATFTSARALYIYFVLAVDLQKSGEMDLNEIFILYDEIQEKITKEQDAYAEKLAPLFEKEEAGTELTKKEKYTKGIVDRNLEGYAKAIAGMNKTLGDLADCENLIPLYQKDFEEKKADIDWIKRAASRMSSKECTKEPFFEKLVLQLDKLEPSANTALYLGQLAQKNGDNAKAMKYFEESAERQTDPGAKAKAYLKIAEQLKGTGSYSRARSFYLKAVGAKPSLGVVYLQIASMYAASANNCGTDNFSKRAVYWLAADYAARAGRIDPSLSSNANAAAARYKGLAPSKTEVFNANNGGEKIQIGCWIGQSVTVPNY